MSWFSNLIHQVTGIPEHHLRVAEGWQVLQPFVEQAIKDVAERHGVENYAPEIISIVETEIKGLLTGKPKG